MSKMPEPIMTEPELTAPVMGEPDPVTPERANRLAWARRRRSLATYWKTFRKSRQGMVGLCILGFFVVLALTAPYIVDLTQIAPATADGPILHPPTAGYPLGTDNFGRNVLSMVVYGSRISLLIGFTATVGAMAIGSSMGIAAGYFGGRTDTILSAITNWFLVLPWIVLAIVLATVNPFHLPDLGNIILVIAITSWAGTARLVRAQTLSVKERTYVERSRALGSGNWHLVTRHVLPNVMPVIYANTVLMVAIAILSEAALSFLGLGPANTVSWGTILQESYDNGALTAGYWWWFLPPGIAIVLVALSVTLCGYALDEILNPRLRDR